MGHVYASADWHGCWNVAKKVVDFLKPDDILYFLGDATDRGPQGMVCLSWLLTHDNVRYIRGNHDQMFIDCISSIIPKEGGKKNDPVFVLDYYWENWMTNGGNNTWDELQAFSKEEKIKFVNKLWLKSYFNLNYISPKGHSIILEHAGYTPDTFRYRKGHSEQDALWDRDHFNDKWSDAEGFKNTYLIHGHTPVQYLKYIYGYIDCPPLTLNEATEKRAWLKDATCLSKPSIIRYCDGHKFDLDMCTIASNRIALLDLDTFEEIYFDA